MAQDQKSSLENIFSYSFPGNHLFQVSIVKQAADQSYKREYFCFITLAPGTQSQQGGRTFDFNNRITMKVDGHQIGALAYAMELNAQNRGNEIGNFSIYVDNSKSSYGQGGGGKSLFIQRGQSQPKQGSNQAAQPTVTLFFKQGNNQALAYPFTPTMALAASDVLKFIAKKCLELEFARGPVTAQTGTFQNASPVPQGQQMSGQGQQMSGHAQNVANDFTQTFEGFTPDTPF